MKFRACVALAIAAAVSLHSRAEAQWTNRYPKVNGFNHHVYLEGYELPTLGSGPTDPAASPDGRSLAIASRGWLWLLDVKAGEARRLTRGAGVDSRPAWSPEGRRIAFVRDTGKDTALLEIEVARGSERTLVNTPAMDLDPAYSRDGCMLYYSSAESGDFDIWRLDLSSGAKRRLTEDKESSSGRNRWPVMRKLCSSLRDRARTRSSS
jgi:TolB protein